MAAGASYAADVVNSNGQVSQGATIQFLSSTAQPQPATNPVTSGALATTTVSSGTGKANPATTQVTAYCVVTTDATNNIATCTVALSPDGTTYSTVQSLSVAAALNNLGAITLPVTFVWPVGWDVKFTAVHCTVGTLTYC